MILEELGKGKFVLYENVPHIINTLLNSGAYIISIDPNIKFFSSLEDLTPIKLNHNVLLACGFEMKEEGVYELFKIFDIEDNENKLFEDDKLIIQTIAYKSSITNDYMIRIAIGEMVLNQIVNSVKINTLHRLQSLYFDVTEKTLPVNFKKLIDVYI